MAEIEEEVYKDLEETAKSHALTSAAGTLIAQKEDL